MYFFILTNNSEKNLFSNVSRLFKTTCLNNIRWLFSYIMYHYAHLQKIYLSFLLFFLVRYRMWRRSSIHGGSSSCDLWDSCHILLNSAYLYILLQKLFYIIVEIISVLVTNMMIPFFLIMHGNYVKYRKKKKILVIVFKQFLLDSTFSVVFYSIKINVRYMWKRICV